MAHWVLYCASSGVFVFFSQSRSSPRRQVETTASYIHCTLPTSPPMTSFQIASLALPISSFSRSVRLPCPALRISYNSLGRSCRALHPLRQNQFLHAFKILLQPRGLFRETCSVCHCGGQWAASIPTLYCFSFWSALSCATPCVGVLL